MTTPEPAVRAWGNTLRVRAEVFLSGGRTMVGDLHLMSAASLHSGPETPEELLNRPDRFFPLTVESDQTVFLAKHQVLSVGTSAEASEDDSDRRSAARQIPLGVELSDGTELIGTASSELPPDRARALDFLNLGTEFFGLRSDHEVRFVNRSHIRVVTPLD